MSESEATRMNDFDPQANWRRRTMDGERLVAVFRELVQPLGQALPSSSEVVLHDLSMLPDSIVAVSGNVTLRPVGGPATDLLLEQAAQGFPEHKLSYETRLPDGRRMRSSTMIIRDVAGTPVAALCINTDTSMWHSVRSIADMMIGAAASHEHDGLPAGSGGAEPGERAASSGETFAHDVDELAAHILHQAITSVGVPVHLMRKEHKLRVVRELKRRGVFLLRESVDMIAESLGVTRFSIYNYLNEIAETHETDETGDDHDSARESAATTL